MFRNWMIAAGKKKCERMGLAVVDEDKYWNACKAQMFLSLVHGAIIGLSFAASQEAEMQQTARVVELLEKQENQIATLSALNTTLSHNQDDIKGEPNDETVWYISGPNGIPSGFDIGSIAVFAAESTAEKYATRFDQPNRTVKQGSKRLIRQFELLSTALNKK